MKQKLPALDRHEAVAFLDHFADSYRRRGLIVAGLNRDGRAFSIHLEHRSEGMRRDQLSAALRYLGISRAEFFDWYRDR